MPVKLNNLGKPQAYDEKTGLFVGGNVKEPTKEPAKDIHALLIKHGMSEEQAKAFLEEYNGTSVPKTEDIDKKDLKTTILERMKK